MNQQFSFPGVSMRAVFMAVVVGLVLQTSPLAKGGESNERELRIAFISYANPQQVAYDSEAIIKYLEPLLGRPVRGFITLDYGSSIEAMRADKADFAFVDPLAFMMAHEQIGVVPLLLEVYESGQPTYHSSIWVRRWTHGTKFHPRN